VIREGEDGDHFYMVHSGKYNVYLKALGDDPSTSYAAGDSFGELALLYNSARAATVKCEEGGELWALERKAFRQVMVRSGEDKMKDATSFLKTVSILAPLTDEQRGSLTGHLEECAYSDGEYIVSSGQAADALYIVKAGEVVCHVKDEDTGKSKELMRLKEGQFFGESAFDTSKEDAVRAANVVAVGKVKALRLTRAAFQAHLGELGDVISANFKRKVLEGIEIDGTKIFAQLSSDDQDKLLAQLTEKVVEKDGIIIDQGGTNETFYIIKSGEAKVIQKPDSGLLRTPRELATLGTGQYFGERALVKDEPASATIKASSQLSLYCCARPTFNAIFGSLQDLIDSEIKRRDEQALKPDAPKYTDLQIMRILGVGTFGRVRLVMHTPTKVSYALKCMRKAQVVQTKQQLHVLHEKRILAMMEHPFILHLVATYQDAGELYMLMEVALGGELFSLLAKRSPLSDSHARFYACQVVAIFAYMHALKVVYRDLKPENLLLDNEGYLKMVDFGFAKILQDRTWTLCGTPEYLAPEIILNKGHGYGADWWCVGILSYECLTGGTPFVSNDPMDGYRKIIKCRVQWPSAFTPAAKDFIDKLLCVDQTRRLGCLKGGSLDVKQHKWFAGHIDFKKLEAKEIPAPYTPRVRGNMDDSNFQTVPPRERRTCPLLLLPHTPAHGSDTALGVSSTRTTACATSRRTTSRATCSQSLRRPGCEGRSATRAR
jgi:cGMP-dependent protein kinase